MDERTSLLSRLRAAWALRAEPARRAMHVEAMEQRILHSADLGAGLLADAPGAPAIEHRLVDDAGEFIATGAQAQQASSIEIVFIDAATPDYQVIVDDIAAQSRNLEIVLLDAGRDGIEQIGAVLAGRHDVTAIHLISHGSDGSLRLGNASLDADALASHADGIAGWGASLSDDADILIYGCDVAASAQGHALVGALAELTGADVAASEDLTGAAARGGDWELEYAVGTIDARVAASAQLQAQWAGVLNAAPTLSGAENLADITEDPATNTGTLVADLIAGHAGDPDAGALSGIAVTAVDDTHGTWEYSTDGGASWSAFGTPSSTAARLLAADGSTYVRFTPDADWHGTVANGLTFLAWDQTRGANGDTADTTVSAFTLLDQFNSVAYTNNDGTASWKSDWVDSDGSASSGNVRVNGGALELTVVLGGGTIYRDADLGSASNATLTLDYDNQFLIGLGGNVELQISSDGGGSYTTLQTFSQSNMGSGSLSFDITAYATADTRIQLVANGVAIPQVVGIDNIQISYDSVAFSTASASSGITVTPVNDAPEGTDKAIAIAEDTAYVLTAVDFGFSDTHDSPANNFTRVVISSLPAGGTLTLGGVAVGAGQPIDIADIIAGELAYVPPADAVGTGIDSFTFQVQDDGGGTDLDPVANTLSFDATGVNDAPAGTDGTVTMSEDGAYAFAVSDFGFTDPSDTPGNNLLAVRIASLPGAGVLTLNGAAVAAGQFVSAADIAAGLLVFTPAADGNGSGFASFTFQVKDDGGGADLAPIANVMSINVAAVNDAPGATAPGMQSAMSAVPFTFSTAAGNALAIADVDAAGGVVEVTLSAAHGTLTLARTTGLGFVAGSGSNDATMTFTGTVAAVNAALDGLQFRSDTGFSGSTSVSLTVDDLGNTGSGGPLTASTSVAIDVGAVPVLGSPTAPGAPPTSPAAPVTPIVTAPSGSDPVGEPSAPVTESEPESGDETATDGSGRVPDSDTAPVFEPGTRHAAIDVARGDTSSGGRGGNLAYGAPDLRLLLAADAAAEVALADFSLGQGGLAFQAAQSALQSQALLDGMDRVREGLQEESRVEFNTVALTTAASLGLSVGYVLWLLRGGVLVGSMLSSLPAWRFIDPLPILGRLGEEDDMAEPDESLESMVERNNRLRSPDAATA